MDDTLQNGDNATSYTSESGDAFPTTSTDLRIASIRRGKEMTITVDGRPIVAYEGETVHGALTAADIQILGSTMKRHQPRGVLCGMGICYQCLVSINGIPDQRACMTPVEDQMVIETGQKPLIKKNDRMALEEKK